ncbi:MAG TPA: hypothetical protein VJQ82_16080 [Terriglobales bacterium]|nr:hypothetical protein [Terriglobales bacterium]
MPPEADSEADRQIQKPSWQEIANLLLGEQNPEKIIELSRRLNVAMSQEGKAKAEQAPETSGKEESA